MKKEKTMVVTLSTDELSEIVKKSVSEALDAHSRKNVSMPTDSNEDFLTPAEAAKILHVSKSTVFNYEKRGWLQRRKIGLKIFFTHESVNAILNSGNS